MRGYCGRPACVAACVKADAARRAAEDQAARLAVAHAHRDEMVRRHPGLAEQHLDVMVVPGADARLQPLEPRRRAAVLAHVDDLLASTSAAAGDPGGTASAPDLAANRGGDPAVAGSGALVAAACGTCRGFCCRTGGDTGWLAEPSIRRVRAQFPALDDAALRAVYEQALPELAVAGSCAFHGARGCTLERDFRADICNEYLCQPIRGFIAGGAGRAADVVVVRGARVVRATVLKPV